MSKHVHDPHPTVQSVIETAREVWPAMAPGTKRNIACCTGLLDKPALERLEAWADRAGFETRHSQGTADEGRITPPAIITITITKPI